MCNAASGGRPGRLLALAAPVLLSGCKEAALLDPAGRIGADERSVMLLATGLMLIVVVPVIVLTLAFAWRYRASSRHAAHAPDWSHSTAIETVVWLVPCAIVGALAVVTWRSAHALDPYRPVAAAGTPLDVDVVALDWKWLFIYPRQHIATVDEVAFPAGTPVRFHLTSGSVMNSFFVPRLGSQVYVMNGMETRLSLVADHPGDYRGLSANYSGGGFSDMTFRARAMTGDDFRAWVRAVKASPAGTLDAARYRALAAPGTDTPVTRFASVDPRLFQDVLRKCLGGEGAACAPAAGRE